MVRKSSLSSVVPELLCRAVPQTGQYSIRIDIGVKYAFILSLLSVVVIPAQNESSR